MRGPARRLGRARGRAERHGHHGRRRQLLLRRPAARPELQRHARAPFLRARPGLADLQQPECRRPGRLHHVARRARPERARDGERRKSGRRHRHTLRREVRDRYDRLKRRLLFRQPHRERQLHGHALEVSLHVRAPLGHHQITGRVMKQDGTALTGATVALSGSQTSTTTTDSGGNFFFKNLPDGGDYTVTPALSNYTFLPSSKTFGDLGADQATTFTGTLNKYTIGGQVKDAGGKPLAGVALALPGAQSATATSDSNGNYSFANLAAGADYTVTPSKTNYTFTPSNRAVNNLTSDQTADFAAALNHYTLSGVVSGAGGGGLAAVTATLSGAQSATVTTDSNGNYSFANLTAGAGYTVTPSKAGYDFAPSSQVFNNLSSNQPANFTSAPGLFALSGRVVLGNSVGVPGVTLTLTGGQSANATTDSAGNFSFKPLPGGASYTLTPALAGYVFAPASLSLDSLSSDTTAAFNAAPVVFRLSGLVTEKGSPLAGVTVTLEGAHPLLGQRHDQAVTGTDRTYSFSAAALRDYP